MLSLPRRNADEFKVSDLLLQDTVDMPHVESKYLRFHWLRYAEDQDSRDRNNCRSEGWTNRGWR